MWKYIDQFGGTGQDITGVTTDNAIYAWGYDLAGQLGIAGSPGYPGSGGSYSSPIAVVAGNMIAQNRPVYEEYINVIAGQSYAVLLGDGRCKFGETFIGLGVERITISYDI